jgi:hypothetical protein
MNFFNSILENSLKQNLLYISAIASSFYISKSLYDFIKSIKIERKRNKEIKRILESEKSELGNESNLSKEQIIYLYYKILFTVYNKEYTEFNSSKRKILKGNNILQYINYIKQFEIFDEEILKSIYEEFDLEESSVDLNIQDSSELR